MVDYIEKVPGDKNTTGTNSTQHTGADKSKLPFVDLRAEANVQRRLKELSGNSEKVKQLRALEAIVNNQAHAKKVKAIQAMANTYGPPTVVQMKNEILSHSWESSESPLYTAINFLADQTGRSAEEVKADIKYKGSLDKNALTQSDANFRPVSVKAYIDNVTGSGGRKGDALQSGIGHLGNLENLFRGRETKEYDGGHLLGYGWYKDWDLINSAKNISPQDRSENRAIFGWKGAWGQEEIDARDVAKVVPAIVTAHVNYATSNYVVSLGHLASVLVKPSPTFDNLPHVPSLHFITIDTRIPSQYALTYTPARELAKAAFSEGSNQNASEDISGGLGTFIMLSYSVLGGVEEALLRMAPLVSVSARSRFGAGVVSSNTDLYLADFIGDILKLAHIGVAYLMYHYNFPIATAVSIVYYFLGQGTLVGLAQRMTQSITPEGLAPYIDLLANKADSIARSTTTAAGAVATAKTILTEVTNYGYNSRSLASSVYKKLKQD